MLHQIILLILSLIVYFWYKLRKKTQYWDDLGVKNFPYQFPFGSSPFLCNDIVFHRLNTIDVARRQYEALGGEKCFGTYLVAKPVLVVCDPDLVKLVMVKDFHHFVDRKSQETTDKVFAGGTKTDLIWKKQIFSVRAEAWKDLRSIISPIFTSGRMKMMVPFIHEVSSNLARSFDEEAEKGTEFELKEKFGNFSLDTIASCAFGIDAQSFTDPNAPFISNARKIFQRKFKDMIKLMIVFSPWGANLLGMLDIAVFKPKETNFFFDVIMQTLKEREKTGKRRNDLVDLMLDAIKDHNDRIASENNSKTSLSQEGSKYDFDEMTIVSTSLGILIAGYDTTGQTLSYIAYELAKNPDVQRRLQDEIDAAMEENEGELPDYGKTMSMEYLDMVFHEGLRLHPAVGVISRSCVLEYKVPGTNIVLKPGDEICINVAGIHADEKYYPEPERFNPENFSKENKSKRHSYAYLAFGQGPRNCIGMRFAILEAKMALIALLSKFNFVRSKKTVEKVTLDPSSILGACKEGLYIKVEGRKS